MVDDRGRPVDPAEWTFDAVEPLFREVVRRVGGRQRRFDLFGHSAGAQFVHRYVEYAAPETLGRAVAANAGWYTMPDRDATFPYGLADGPTPRPDRTGFGTRLVVMLGGDDVEAENLRSDRRAMAQGETRLQRGMRFFQAARAAASAAQVPLSWELRVVSGVAHDQQAMAQAAATVLLDPAP